MPFKIYEFYEIWYGEMHALYRGENDMFTLFATFCPIPDKFST
jgi:hypothetical protein